MWELSRYQAQRLQRKRIPVATIDQASREIQECVREALAMVDGARAAPVAPIEDRLWSVMLRFGRGLMTMYFTRQASRVAEAARYDHDGVVYEVIGSTSDEIGTLFGKVCVACPVGRVADDKRGARDLPLRRELGLPAGFTPAVIMMVTRLCAQMAFASARDRMRHVFGWTPSPRAVLRMVDGVGDEVRPFLEQVPAPDDDGEVLVMTVDGKGAPAISSREKARRKRPRAKRPGNGRHGRRQRRRHYPRVRRGPGKKSKNAKMAAVGVLYTLRRDADGKLEGPINKRTIATFESYRALFEWLAAEARRRGYGTDKFTKVLFLADGAEVLWTLQQEFFPDAIPCLDWFHVVEKIWDCGKAVCRGTRRKRAELEAWVAKQKKRLRQGKVADVISDLEQALVNTSPTGPGNKYRRKVLGNVIDHFIKHIDRMQYAKLRKQDLDIASGVVEGAVRHLVGVRLDGPGMRWGRDRMEAVLHLRCVLINGLWDDFRHHVAKLRQFRLRAQPVPTRSHDAVTKKAA